MARTPTPAIVTGPDGFTLEVNGLGAAKEKVKELSKENPGVKYQISKKS